MNLAIDRLPTEPRTPRIASARAIEGAPRHEARSGRVDARGGPADPADATARAVVIAPLAWRRTAPPPQGAAFAAQLFAQAPERRAAHVEDRASARRAYAAAIDVAQRSEPAPGPSVSLLV